jgi:hypothetical protein
MPNTAANVPSIRGLFRTNFGIDEDTGNSMRLAPFLT